VEDLGVALALLLTVHGVRLSKGLVRQMIMQSPAAQHLVSIGYGNDVKFVCAVDRYNVVPLYEKGRVAQIRLGSPLSRG
jgi:phosphosulfolactate phosphohydrolase-like enzyme